MLDGLVMTVHKRLLIIANTPSANTKTLVNAAVRGATHPDIGHIDVHCIPPLQAQATDVLNAHGILIGTTENFGYMSGEIKDFFDRIYYPCLEKTEGLPYSCYIRAGLDGTGTEIAIKKIISGLKWNQAQPIEICKGDFTDDFIEQVETLAMTMSAGVEAGIF